MKLTRAHRLAALSSQPIRPGDKPMRVENETRWNTRDLAALFSACCAANFTSSDRRVVVIAARRRRSGFIGDRDESGRLKNEWKLGLSHGRAYVGSRWIRMSIPDASEHSDWKRVAQIFEHELQHNLGLNHADMPDWWNLPVLWATPTLLVIRRKPEPDAKPEPTRDERASKRRELKLVRAQRAVETWERKAKMARTKLAVWKRRLGSAERAQAASQKHEQV